MDNQCQLFWYTCACVEFHLLRVLALIYYCGRWQEEGTSCVEHLAVFVPSRPHPLLSATVYQCDGCMSSQGHGG